MKNKKNGIKKEQAPQEVALERCFRELPIESINSRVDDSELADYYLLSLVELRGIIEIAFECSKDQQIESIMRGLEFYQATLRQQNQNLGKDIIMLKDLILLGD